MSVGGWVTVNTPLGTLKGKKAKTSSGKNYCAFLGVPYARPPVGELRFKPPQPAEKWSGIRDATKEGSKAPQLDDLTRQFVGDEDCLFLNVYTPKVPTGPGAVQLPVMVWIHGGGFTVGSGSSEVFGPDYLLQHDVIVVTVNYRLGVLGFASTGDSVISGNMGLKDQVLALRWVKSYISSFGGDPGSVTIFGESAGAMSCHALILSPMAKGLFHRAILQSGVITGFATFSTTVAERTILLAQQLGETSRDSQQVASFLGKVPAQTLVEKILEGRSKEDKERMVVFPFLPTLEPSDVEGGAFFSQHPLEILKNGSYNRVPIINGVNSHEGMLMFRLMAMVPNALRSLNMGFQRMLPTDLPVSKDERLSLGRELKRFYFGDQPLDEETTSQFFELQGDTTFNFPAFVAAKLHASQPSPPVYLYKFSVDAEFNLFKKLFKLDKMPGACHADELGYLFRPNLAALGEFQATPDSVEAKTIARMTKLWTDFAKTGNPTPQPHHLIEVTWPPFRPKATNFLNIENGGLSISTDFYKERMDFWERLYTRIGK